MMNVTKYILFVYCFLYYTGVKAQQKNFYYENQTRYGTFRNYENDGSKLINGRDYAAEMASSQQEAKRMTAERQRQRQAELERMRKSSGNSQATEYRQPENDIRFETLKFSNGNTYTGKTLNGEPHGEGSVTFARDGRVMKGEFKYGQANGMMTITDKHYVQTGKFVNGKPVGDQRYEFDDGKTKLVEIRNMETGASTVQYPDKTSFSGSSDENGKYLKGKVVYSSGITFDGDYKNGRPYRGIWEKEGRIMIGEFGESTPGELLSKLLFMISPGFKTYYFGIYSFATQWTSFLSSSDTGWGTSEAINGFTENGSATNSLKLEKAGDQISVYANGKHLFTQKMSESGRQMENIAGVGIVQKGMAQGQLLSIRFQVPNNLK